MSNSKPPDPLGVAARTRPGSFQLPKLAKTLQVREALGRACLRSKAPPWKQRISGLCAASCVLVCLCTYMIIQKHIYICIFTQTFLYLHHQTRVHLHIHVHIGLSVCTCSVYEYAETRTFSRCSFLSVEVEGALSFYLRVYTALPESEASSFGGPTNSAATEELLEAGVFRHSGFWGSSRLGKWQV